MAIFYINPVNGSDAAAGTSWATAWKTFATGPTAARIAPGDEIRIAKSPDPTDVGTATWTDHKIGNSITFDTAPTKQIDLCKSGWVTLGGGSTVTNNQATAYMMWGSTPGTGSALQIAATAVTNLAYKNLGSVQDFSAYQQVCFWFRTTVAIDCTGAQNVIVQLCSDTAGTVNVNTVALPKWSYSANVWYPIVVDTGGALGSSIQSVAIRTSAAISTTIYIDEMFASPAGGLTLWSLIEDNDNTWYPIRTIRDADVWLISSFVAGTATGATTQVAFLDPAWVGTTANFMTRKRETIKTWGTTAAVSPATGIWCQTNEAGYWPSNLVKQINQYRFGFDTITDTQNGHTYIDNLVQLGTFYQSANAAWRIENVILVRFSTGLNSSAASSCEFNNIGAIGCLSQPINIASYYLNPIWISYNKTINLLSVTGNNAAISLTGNNYNGACPGYTINFLSNMWGNQGDLVTSGYQQATYNMKHVMCTGSTSSTAITYSGGYSNIINIGRIEHALTTTWNIIPSSSPSMMYINASSNDRFYIDSIYGGNGISSQNFSNNTIVSVGTYSGTGTSLVNPTPTSTGTVYKCTNNNSTATGYAKWYAGPQGVDTKIFIQDINGPGTAAVFSGIGQQSGINPGAVFELQTGDVRTSGSKAWKYTLNGPTAYVCKYLTNTLKLASVAAVANKLVTVTCYVKRSADAQQVGLRVPAVFLPGYTTNITSIATTFGTWEQVTLTFTPTADCVFDVEAYVYYDNESTVTDAVWDDLSITQAA